VKCQQQRVLKLARENSRLRTKIRNSKLRETEIKDNETMKIQNKPVFILLARGFRLIAGNVPAQRDSGIYKLAGGNMGLMGGIGVMGLMGGKPEKQNSSAQRDSGMSNLGMGLMSPIGSIGLMGEKPEKQNSSAQRDSGMSNLGIGLMWPIGHMGLWAKSP